MRWYYLRFRRGLHIVFIILGYLWINWLSKRRVLRRFVPRRYKRKGTVISEHERLRMVIEKLGPTFIKFGQILADRPDIVSEKFREELKKLQSAAKPFEHELAMELIERELGAPINSVFEFIDPVCIGSASIGQVYKARMKEGRLVVIKIQRPDIKEKIEMDLQLLHFLAARLAKEYPELVVMNVTGLVREFGETIMLELNYFHEGSNAMRFAGMFKDVPYCKIPKVYMNISTHRMLVMEYIQGVAPDSPHELLKHGLDPKVVADHGIHIFLKMIFEHGFFHADPHAGNIFVQKGNRIALIDFGMAGSLKPSHMQFLAGFTLGLATKNAQRISEALLRLSGNKFFKEREDLEFRVEEMLKRYGSLSYEKIKFSQVLNECVKIILKYELKIPASIYLLIKALATLEKFGHNLDRNISLATYIRPYAIALIRKQYSPKAVVSELMATVKDYFSVARSFPQELSEIMYKVKQGKLIHDIQLSNEEAFTRSFKQLGRIIALACVIGFTLAGSSIMITWGHNSWLPDFMFMVSSIFAVWLLLRLFFKIRI